MGFAKRHWAEMVENGRDDLEEKYIDDNESDFKKWIDEEKLDDLKTEFIEEKESDFLTWTLDYLADA